MRRCVVVNRVLARIFLRKERTIGSVDRSVSFAFGQLPKRFLDRNGFGDHHSGKRNLRLTTHSFHSFACGASVADCKPDNGHQQGQADRHDRTNHIGKDSRRKRDSIRHRINTDASCEQRRCHVDTSVGTISFTLEEIARNPHRLPQVLTRFNPARQTRADNSIGMITGITCKDPSFVDFRHTVLILAGFQFVQSPQIPFNRDRLTAKPIRLGHDVDVLNFLFCSPFEC